MERIIRSKLVNFLSWQIFFWILFFIFYPQILANAMENLGVRILVASTIIGLFGADTIIFLDSLGHYLAM